MKLNNNTECKVYSYKLVKHQCMSVAFSVLKNENENFFFFSRITSRPHLWPRPTYCSCWTFKGRCPSRQELEDDQVGGISFVYNSDALHWWDGISTLLANNHGVFFAHPRAAWEARLASFVIKLPAAWATTTLILVWLFLADLFAGRRPLCWCWSFSLATGNLSFVQWSCRLLLKVLHIHLHCVFHEFWHVLCTKPPLHMFQRQLFSNPKDELRPGIFFWKEDGPETWCSTQYGQQRCWDPRCKRAPSAIIW